MKEPIKNKKIWLGFLAIFIMLTPWYFPTGGETMLIYGVPLWAIIIILMSMVLSLYITYVIRYHWDTLDEEDTVEEEK
ncbi:hypothetical protein [Lacicoccus alkaliphilus]|uniref:DUF3311 domain-containing protein n=1 Tax=Lacicoccus alkaliphilus DSM 16010 TaxID=1123231 RepID=A0A1M7DT75_9BACL|nr:hypothetical protein [Salinicoccus alkaliphilus]SHL82389.1 hypothetical protein SAMN02745189_00977 [Salinicoccus alkaliphilus DSM 16010]